MIVNVYVPKPGALSLNDVHPGSALVGTPHPNGRVTVDFEGNLYGAVNLGTYEERLLHAADRHRTSYPTVARRYVPEDDVILVGTYDTDTKQLVHDDSPAFWEWRGDA